MPPGPLVYLDNNATTAMDPAVTAVMTEILADGPANASAIHAIGQRAKHRLNTAREDIAKALGASPHEIVFTGSGSEADNMAIAGVLRALAERHGGNGGKDAVHLVTTAIEHPAVENTARALAAEGFRVTTVPCTRDGFIEPGAIAEAIDASDIEGAATLVTVIAAHNETGAAYSPVARILPNRPSGALGVP